MLTPHSADTTRLSRWHSWRNGAILSSATSLSFTGLKPGTDSGCGQPLRRHQRVQLRPPDGAHRCRECALPFLHPPSPQCGPFPGTWMAGLEHNDITMRSEEGRALRDPSTPP